MNTGSWGSAPNPVQEGVSGGGSPQRGLGGDLGEKEEAFFLDVPAARAIRRRLNDAHTVIHRVSPYCTTGSYV